MEKFSWESRNPGACIDRREPGEISMRRELPQTCFASWAGKPPNQKPPPEKAREAKRWKEVNPRKFTTSTKAGKAETSWGAIDTDDGCLVQWRALGATQKENKQQLEAGDWTGTTSLSPAQLQQPQQGSYLNLACAQCWMKLSKRKRKKGKGKL